MSDTLTNALAQAGRSSSVLGGIANPAVVNPLAGYGSAISAVQGIQGLQEKAAQQAAGQAYQGAINQDTGEFDPNKFRTLLAQSPAAAMAAGTALANTQQISSDELNQNLAKAKWANAAAGSLTRLGPNITQQDAISALHDGLTQGILTPAEYQRQVAQLPSDPAGLNAWANQHQFTAMSVQQQLERSAGTTTLENVGGVSKPVTLVPAQPGGTAPASATVGQGGVSQGLTPAQLAQPHDYTDANGVTQHSTVGEYLKTLGVPIPTGGQQVSAPTSSAPSASPSATVPPPPSGTSVRPAPSGAPSATPPTPAQPAATPTAQPSTTVSPTGGRSIPGAVPGQTEALQDTAKQSAAMGTALTARADQVPTNKANYANMLTDLGRIGNMPPGGEREIAINTFLQKATGYGITMTPDQIAAGNSFAKLANIAVGQQLQAIGGTDARQALFMGSNPNLDLSKLGNTQIIHMLQGNEDAIQAKSRAWQSWQQAGNGPGTYASFQDDFNHHFDPRVFQQQYMQGPEIASLRKSLGAEGPGATQKFLDDVKYARGQHWIQ